jgi:4-diphosphocytidyl-2C-methyl-D-erythritol kinase
MMSGSGPSVFGVFADVESAKTVENMLKGEGYFAQVAEPVSAEEARGIKTLIK